MTLSSASNVENSTLICCFSFFSFVFFLSKKEQGTERPSLFAYKSHLVDGLIEQGRVRGRWRERKRQALESYPTSYMQGLLLTLAVQKSYHDEI